jgi:hypothetical protein
MRSLIELTLHEALDRANPGWKLRSIQRKTVRKEAAYADHHIGRKLLPPLRSERRT